MMDRLYDFAVFLLSNSGTAKCRCRTVEDLKKETCNTISKGKLPKELVSIILEYSPFVWYVPEIRQVLDVEKLADEMAPLFFKNELVDDAHGLRKHRDMKNGLSLHGIHIIQYAALVKKYMAPEACYHEVVHWTRYYEYITLQASVPGRNMNCCVFNDHWVDLERTQKIEKHAQNILPGGQNGLGRSIELCAGCNKPQTKRCSRCKAAFYCSRRCQNWHWSIHRPICDATQVTAVKLSTHVIIDQEEKRPTESKSAMA